jgi:hypothetical protein
MKSWYWAGLGLGVVAVIASCSDEPLRCGPGTAREGNECVIPRQPSAGANNSGGSGAIPNGAGKGGYDAAAGSAGDHSDVGMGGDPDPSGGAAGDSGGSGGNAGSGGLDQTGLITTALACGSRDVTGAKLITEPITQDTTWSGVIHLPKGLSVRNEPTLTITPGTKIIVGHDATVEFGWLGSHATIVANGTVEQPIMFCGETDTAGYWTGLIFRSGIKSASILRNVLIADGGSTDAGLTLEMPLLLQGVQVRHSGANGVNAVGFDRASSTLIVSGATKAAVKATAARGAEVPLGSQLTGNALDVIDVAFASFDADVTLRDLGVPYRQLADTTAGSAATTPPSVVTFEPGVVYSIAKQKRLDFGNATVHALGSAEKPIVFQGLICPQPETSCPPSAPPSTVDSGGLVLASGSDVRFEYVELLKLGSTVDAAFTMGAGTLKVAHVNIVAATGSGLVFSGSGKFSEDSHNFDVSSRLGGAVLRLGCGQVATLPADTKVGSMSSSNRVYTALDCTHVNASSTWSSFGSPYSLSGLEIVDGASLTLQPGTTLRFAPDNQLLVHEGSTLNAIGTATSIIEFVPDGSSNWGGIYADTGSTVILDYALIDRAGSGSSGSAVYAKAPLTLLHSTIINSSAWALKKLTTDPTDYLAGNSFSGNALGNISTLP